MSCFYYFCVLSDKPPTDSKKMAEESGMTINLNTAPEPETPAVEKHTGLCN